MQERTREAAAHERIVDHMILLRLLLAFATGQRGSATRLGDKPIADPDRSAVLAVRARRAERRRTELHGAHLSR